MKPGESEATPRPETAETPVRPTLRQTLLLIGWVWLALAVMAVLLQGWLGRSFVLHFISLALGLVFAGVALGDYLCQRWR